jgi:nucleoside-diphosphate-sugar epimerase
MSNIHPATITNEAELDEVLAEPTDELVAALRSVEGDVLVLGVGGKMGPTLARLAKRGIERGGLRARVIGVSRFSEPGLEGHLREAGVETIAGDLLDDAFLEQLPYAPNIVFMAGRKFGSTGAEELTWAMNVYLPGQVARRYRDSRIAIFSTGNVYPLLPVTSGGATEAEAVAPVGEYAQSCLGRERIFTYFSGRYGTRQSIVRLNYAIDLRYGILHDVATKVWSGQPVDLTMGNVNVIWQGDANAAVLRSLALAASPPLVLNLTGPETVSIRQVANHFGAIFGRSPIFVGQEASTALLSNAGQAHALLGYPRISLETMIRWVAHWVSVGGRDLGKPTHFETRDGRF